MESSITENQVKSSAMSDFMRAYRQWEVVALVRMPLVATFFSRSDVTLPSSMKMRRLASR